MKVYVVEPRYDQFKSYVPVNPEAASIQYTSLRCKGEPIDWPSPLSIKVEEEDMGMPEADIGFINIGSLVFSETAKTLLGSLALSHGQLLPLNLSGRPFWLWNVTTVVNALDKSKSTFNQYGGVAETVFSLASLNDVEAFKIPEDNYTNIYCTDVLAGLIQQHQLKGVELTELAIA